MKEAINTDDYFRNILSKSKLELPFPDFEDQVMYQIEKKNALEPPSAKDIKLSCIFFILGTAFGLFISLILPKIQESIFGIDLTKLAVPFQIGFVILVFLQIDQLMKLVKKAGPKI